MNALDFLKKKAVVIYNNAKSAPTLFEQMNANQKVQQSYDKAPLIQKITGGYKKDIDPNTLAMKDQYLSNMSNVAGMTGNVGKPFVIKGNLDAMKYASKTNSPSDIKWTIDYILGKDAPVGNAKAALERSLIGANSLNKVKEVLAPYFKKTIQVNNYKTGSSTIPMPKNPTPGKNGLIINDYYKDILDKKSKE